MAWTGNATIPRVHDRPLGPCRRFVVVVVRGPPDARPTSHNRRSSAANSPVDGCLGLAVLPSGGGGGGLVVVVVERPEGTSAE